MALTGSRLLKLAAPTAALAATLALAPFGVDAVHEGDYPGHIHAGSCDDLGDVVFPLGNASLGGMMSGSPEAGTSEMEMGEMMGSEDRVPVATSLTTVDVSLEDILADEHAINFHLSEEEIGTYIACGDIGGAVMTGPGMDEGGTLVIGLRDLNDSGISGVATLEGMGDQTEVAVYLAEDLMGAGAADATPTS